MPMTAHIASTPWIMTMPRSNRAAMRIFCLPSAGSGASQYISWARIAPADVEICPIQLPGRESRLRETPIDRMDSLVPPLVEALLPYLDRPFALFGHSMGALIAFEIARALQNEAGVVPEHLFLSGRRAAHLSGTESRIHDLPTAEFLRQLILRYDGIPDALLQDREALRLYLPILRADLAVVETYDFQPGPAVRCPIVAFGGTEDQRATIAELNAWREHTEASFSLRMFPGGHFFIVEHKAKLLRLMSQALSSTAVDC